MRCPYCRHSLKELSPECPGCRLNLQRATAILGPVPRIELTVSDSTDALSKGGHRQIRKRIKALHERFPQVDFQVVIRNFPEDHPFELYVFWLFNQGALHSDHHKAGDNHGVLLVIDPVTGRSSLMVGYGLEPFIAESSLDEVLAMAAAAWIDREWAEGVMLAIDALEARLEGALNEIHAAFDMPIHPGSRQSRDF